jgi:hypothetical protein
MAVVLGTDGYRYEVNDGWAKLPPDMEKWLRLYRAPVLELP